MNDTLPIIRYKLPEGMGISDKCLGRFASRLDFVKKEPYCIIYVDIKKIIKHCKDFVEVGWDITFDQVFSHVFSHEYIHYLLSIHVGNIENCAFDNIFGVMEVDPKYIYSGVKLEGDPPYILPKRHFCTIELLSIVKTTVCRFYTKLINSIRNIIRKVIKCNVKNVE